MPSQYKPKSEDQYESNAENDFTKNMRGASELPMSNNYQESEEEEEQVLSEEKQVLSEKADYEKKFTGNIIGLDSDESSSKRSPEDLNSPNVFKSLKSVKSSELNEVMPPPPDSDAKYSDEYFDADEDYLEQDHEHALENENNGQKSNSEGIFNF